MLAKKFRNYLHIYVISSKWWITDTFFQDLVEKVMVLQKAVQDNSIVGEATAQKFATYASILASQGKFEAAKNYLPESSDKVASWECF